MTADRPATEPRTEAGRTMRTLLMDMYTAWAFIIDANGIEVDEMPDDPLPLILAIEAEAALGAAPRAEGLDVERLLEVAMTARRMVEDGHPDSPEWFRIMSERLSTVMDLTDAALMDGLDAVVARLSRPSDERVPESEEPRA